MYTKIKDREDRDGSGELQLVDFKLRSTDGTELLFLRNGETAIFHFTFSANKSLFEKPSFRFGINSSTGSPGVFLSMIF